MIASTPKVTGLTLANGFGYGYYASDALGELRYPSGRLVRYCPDDKLRVKWVSAAKSMGDCISAVAPAQGEAYASGIEYAPHGRATKWSLGNGLKEAVGFNARLQPERLRVGTANDPAVACGLATDALCLELSYGSLTGNTGNILSQRIWAAKASGGHLNIEQGYGYDAVNRLTTFTETVVGGGGATAGNWTETNQYDRWGNRWATSTASQHAATPRMASHINTAKNQVTATLAGSVGYDPGGNMITHPSYGSIVYDAENRVVSAGGASYGYDGEGRRVSKTVNGATVYYLYDGQGQLAVEMGGDSAPVGTTYVHVDHLGSTRMVTDAGAAVKSRTDYTAFGEEIAATAALGNRDLVPAYGSAGPLVRYTGQVRDTESGLDWYVARHYGAAMGRFASSDEWPGGMVDALTGASQPIGPLPYADITDPQTINKYAYVRNNPLRFNDPDGHCGVLCPAIPIVMGALSQGPRAAPMVRTAGAVLLAGALAVSDKVVDALEKAGPPCGTYICNYQVNQSGGGNASAPQDGGANGSATGDPGGGSNGPKEPYDRRKHYGNSPKASDRKAVGGESVDHDPPLVKRYYDGDPKRGERPGYQQTPAERRQSANDRTRMRPATRQEQNAQGAQMSRFSQDKKK